MSGGGTYTIGLNRKQQAVRIIDMSTQFGVNSGSPPKEYSGPNGMQGFAGEDPKKPSLASSYIPHSWSVGAGFAFLGGAGVEIGKVYAQDGDSWFFRFDGRIGFGMGWGINYQDVKSDKPGGAPFSVDDWAGNDFSTNIQFGMLSLSRGGSVPDYNKTGAKYQPDAKSPFGIGQKYGEGTYYTEGLDVFHLATSPYSMLMKAGTLSTKFLRTFLPSAYWSWGETWNFGTTKH